ncbi:efflux RND transporter permease subunit, partial [Aliarcobacter butzleri]|uniref:efflux RND transporter permease subunit n=1 Tax=Aliarcobacter butzleri TaxID=28197 RepID=UPI003AEBA5DD
KNRFQKVLESPKKYMFGYILIIALLADFVMKLPPSFLPKEDQGRLMVRYTLPDGAASSRTVDMAENIKNYVLTEEKN